MWQWAHLLGFNLYWLLAVKWQQPGPLLLMLLLHFLFSPRRRQDWRLIPVALAGCLLDILLWRLGLFQFPAGFPLWLLLLIALVLKDERLKRTALVVAAPDLELGGVAHLSAHPSAARPRAGPRRAPSRARRCRSVRAE